MNFLRRLLCYLLVPREYRKVGDVLYVKERGKDWEPLMGHLRREHPKEYALIKESEKDEV